MNRFKTNNDFLYSGISSPANFCSSPNVISKKKDEKKLLFVDPRLNLHEKDYIRLRMFLRNCTSRLMKKFPVTFIFFLFSVDFCSYSSF
jgi:hypothetical protein